jgi:3-oxoacyl-(acyl-carrier-protein) synthase
MIGASAACSVAFATQHLLTGEVPALPYFDEGDDLAVEARYVLVTALGFGGVAAALILARD